MNLSFKKYLFVFLGIVVLTVTKAQESDSTYLQTPKSAISFVPQYLIKNGIRIEYDLKIKEHHWLQICPQFYLREKNVGTPQDYYGYYSEIYDPEYSVNSDDESYFNHLLGGGINLYHRYYPGMDFGDYTIYINYGIMSQYFHIKYDEQLYAHYNERYTKILKSGGDINLGVIALINKQIGIDIYAGLGFRYSNYQSDADHIRKFNNFFDSYGFSGNIINAGVRLTLFNY